MRGCRFVLLVGLAMLAGACGDSGGATTTDGEGGATTTTVHADTTTSTRADTAPTTTTTGGGDGDATTTTYSEDEDDGDGTGLAAGGDVGELLERFREMRLRATYLMEADQSTLTISQDPTADPPVSAYLSEEEGFHVIFDGDSMTMCDVDQQQCFAVPAEIGGGDPSLFAGAFLSPFLASFLAFSTADTPGFDVDTEPVEVAGRSGVCFTVTPEAALGADFDEIRQCVDDETGAMLLFEIKEAGGDFERVLELVEFGDPRPSDFEPPFKVVDFPTG